MLREKKRDSDTDSAVTPIKNFPGIYLSNSKYLVLAIASFVAVRTFTLDEAHAYEIRGMVDVSYPDEPSPEGPSEPNTTTNLILGDMRKITGPYGLSAHAACRADLCTGTFWAYACGEGGGHPNGYCGHAESSIGVERLSLYFEIPPRDDGYPNDLYVKLPTRAHGILDASYSDSCSTARASYSVHLDSFSPYTDGLKREAHMERTYHDLTVDGLDKPYGDYLNVIDVCDLEVALVKAGKPVPGPESVVVEVVLNTNIGWSSTALGRAGGYLNHNDTHGKAYTDFIIQFDNMIVDAPISFNEAESGFFLECCSLGIYPTHGGSVTVDGRAVNEDHYWFRRYYCDTNVPIEAHPDPGFEFLKWTGTAVREGKVAIPTARETTVYVDGNYDLKAEFVSTECTLYLGSTVGGRVDIPGEGTFVYDCGVVETVRATPDPGYKFFKWTGTAVSNGKVDNEYAANTTVLVDGRYDLKAEFVSESMCILYISSTKGGSVNKPGESAYKYFSGREVLIEAEDEDPGDPWQLDLWHFAGWTGTAVDANMVADPADPCTIVITQPCHYTLKANFELNIMYTKVSLYTYSTSGGSVTTPGEGWFYYDYGSLVTISAKPEEFYLFEHWLCDGGGLWDSEALTTLVTMSGDQEVEACFSLDIPPAEPRDWRGLAIYSTDGGSVTTPGEAPFRYDLGSRVRIEAEAYPGYHFVNWSGTGAGYVGEPSSPSTSVTMWADCVLRANFEPGNIVVPRND